MGLTKPSITRKQGTSQATPLANDTLQMIRNQITSGEFGTGFGPLQREAGTAARQFVNSGGGNFETSGLVKDLESIHSRRVDKGAADLKEQYSLIGGRQGTGAMNAEGDFRAKAEADFGGQLGEIFRQEFANQQNRLLSGIGMLFGMGTQATQPAFDLSALGIMPETFFASDSPLNQFSGLLRGIGGLIPGKT